MYYFSSIQVKCTKTKSYKHIRTKIFKLINKKIENPDRMTPTAKSIHLFSLDIIRGLAALIVLITHFASLTAQPLNPLSGENKDIFDYILKGIYWIWQAGGMHPSIIVFIVLSGFCIHLPLSVKPNQAIIYNYWISYGIRRFLRIGPLYLCTAIVGIMTVFFFVYFRQEAPDFLQGDIKSISPLGIFLTLTCLSGLMQFMITMIPMHQGNGPLFTVAVEALLYATYPFLYKIKERTKSLNAMIIIIVIALAFYCLYVALRFLGVSHNAVGGGYFEFLLYWIIGAISCEFFVKFRSVKLFYLGVITTLFLALLYLGMTHLIVFKGSYFISSPILALFAGVLLYTVSIGEALGLIKANVLLFSLAKLGERSYSLYAIHMPIIIWILFLHQAFHCSLNQLELRLICIITVFIITEITYKYLEKPSHNAALKMATVILRNKR